MTGSVEHPLITARIKALTGTSLRHVSVSALDRLIGSMMDSCSCTSEAEFLSKLQHTPSLQEQLIHASTVKETYFFREPATIEMVMRSVMPRLLAAGDSVRILSAGCSSGAEAYSLAMAIDQTFGSAVLRQCTIEGIDVDPLSVRAAEAARYSDHTLRGLSKQVYRTYFTAAGVHEHQVRDHIRKRVSFQTANLADAQQLSKLGSYDIIFYRNVSIYFDQQTRTTVFTNLAELLKPQGVLCTSPSETFSHTIGVLHLVHEQAVFYFSKTPSEPAPQPVAAPAGRPQRVHRTRETQVKREQNPRRTPKRTNTSSPTLEQVIGLSRAGDHARALGLIEQLDTEDHRVKIVHAGILLEINRSTEAMNLCRALIEADPMLLEPHIHLALIHRSQDDPAQALQELKIALYIEPSCWVALFHAAEIYRKQGQDALALRDYRRTLAAVASGVYHQELMISTIDDHSKQQIIRLCTHHIEQMTLRS
ncbi:MAG: hypothetical protein K9M84_00210 [Spirochaetia bacterium]|nr:hypothetical protein [Spirochaetia bacterium]